VSEYRTDEETVEQIQRFWRENGLTLVVTLVLSVGAVLGWRAWDDARAAAVGDASARYLEWREALAPDGGPSEEATRIAEALRSEYPDSPYVSLIRFHVARHAVESDDAEAARRELLAVLDADLPEAFHDVARLRLARLAIADDDPAAALVLLDAIAGAQALPTVLELRGDALLASGDRAAARAAYDAAIEAAEDAGGVGRPLLEMKRDDLAIAAAPEAP
jgi:predicted negative regulator of RcsB-dependent stress response